MSRDALAACLRRLSREGIVRDRQDELLEEATALSLRAIELALAAGPIGRIPAAYYFNALADHLREAEELDLAIECIRRAECCLARSADIEAQVDAALQGPPDSC